MIGYAVLAFVNGWIVGTSRAMNGRLGVHTTSFNSSLWNNIGALFVSALLLIPFPPPTLGNVGAAPLIVYVGGVLGALFVAVNSFVLPKLGASTTLSLIIAGQTLAGLLIDVIRTGSWPTVLKLGAIALIAAGAIVATTASRNQKPPLDL